MTQETPVDVTLEPGFYWVLPVFDVDSDADSWRQHEQPAYWDGERWAMLDTEDWAVRWVGSRIASNRPTQTDAVSVERVGDAIGYALCELEEDTLAHGLTRQEWQGLAQAALTAMNTSRDAEVERLALKHIVDADPGPKSDQSLAHEFSLVARQALAHEGD